MQETNKNKKEEKKYGEFAPYARFISENIFICDEEKFKIEHILIEERMEAI